MKTETNYAEVFDNANIWQILFKIAPPVMLARLGVGFCFADAGRRSLI